MGLAYVAPIGLQNLFVINSALAHTRRRALITALIVIFIDVTLALACFFGIGALMERFQLLNMLIMLVGIVLFAVGTGLYAAADLGRGSYEAVTFALAEKNHWQVKVVRMILDAAMVVIGVILGGKFGVCTVVTVIVSGPVIQFTVTKAKKIMKL